MNGVEAAASLFGPDDSNSDPFASLGDDLTPNAEPLNNHHGLLTRLVQDNDPTFSDLYGDAQGAQFVGDPTQDHSSTQQGALQDYGQPPVYPSSVPEKEYQNSEWYGSGQRQTDDVQGVQTSFSHYETDSSLQASQANTTFRSAYSPGSEISGHSSSQSAYNSYIPTSTNSAYTNSYAPVTNTPESSPYPPSTASLVQRTSTYTSAASTTYNASTSPNYNVNVPSLPAVNVPAPPAPAPANTIQRPKVSNAYDPPFPPPTKSKRVVSRSGTNQTPAAVYNSYQGGSNAYNHSLMNYPPSVQPRSIPNTEPPPSGMPLLRNDHAFPTNATNLKRDSVDGLPRQDSTNPAYQPAWSIQADTRDDYRMEGKVTEHENAYGDLKRVVEGGEMHYSIGSFSTRERKDESRPDGFSPSMPWRSQVGQNGGKGTETSPKQSPNSSPPRARISSDYDAAPRTFSPERLTEHIPDTSPNRKPQVSPTTWTETRGINATNLYENGTAPSYPGTSSSIFSQAPPPMSPDAFGPPKSNRYNVDERRAASPGSQSIRSLNGRQSTKPQPGVRPPSRIGALRGRSMSNEPSLGSSEHYGQYPRSQLSGPEPGSVLQTPFSIGQSNYPALENPTISHDSFVKSQAPYAPSPSLLGTNDPLRRTSAQAPVISFGFGGKLVTCFHGSNTLNTGFDVALASRRTTSVQIQQLSKILPASTLDGSTSSFPGPLFSDPGASSSSLVRTTASSQRNKKAGIVKYLTERVEEISHGLGYLTQGSAERRQAEGKLVLVKLLRAMVENDGRLSGSSSVESSVRSALVPRLEGSLGIPTSEFMTTADTHTLHSDAGVGSESVISVSTLRSSSIDRIQEFLLRGERRQAYHYALDEKLWAHAMVIASSVDKEAWKEVITEFLRAELGVKDDVSTGTSCLKGKDTPSSSSNGREALRVAYSLYSGQGPASIQELVPQTLLGRATAKLQIQNATVGHATPRTPNFHPPPPTTNIPPETLAKWTEIVAMMVSTAVNAEASSALTTLGDQLLAAQYVEAAHACYLLAPQTSLMGGLGNPAVRIILVGSNSPASVPNFSADPEPFIFSEIVEFALSLSPIAKGQEAFTGLPHLQAYRFIRAVSLAEIGDIQLANRYCEAISASLGRPSPYFTSTLLDQLRGLADRISGTSHVDKSSSWMGSKIGKPSLDSIGGWLEGRFTKLVTGETESSAEAQERTSLEERMFSGPFSTISSASPSARSSPQPTPATVSLGRTDSAISPQNSYNPVDRAASAMDYYKPKVASAPRVVSAGPAITSFSQPQPRLYDQDKNSSDLGADSVSSLTNGRNDQEALTWWGGSGPYNYNDSTSTKTPTATSFMRIDESAVRTTPDGFISLMDTPTFSATATHDSPRPSTLAEEEDDDDLGLGNTKHKKEKTVTENDKATSSTPSESQTPAEPENNDTNTPATTSSSGGSWFSRLWKREAAPGPIKASLGEENAFYYDKELKRWVNKKAGTDDAAPKPAAPPPPSRAQTASPSMNSARLKVLKPPNNTEASSTSAIDLSTSPPIRSTTLVRSNLAPPPALDSGPSTPAMRSGSTGPPGRPRSQASTKRNLRSRYVDVFQPGS